MDIRILGIKEERLGDAPFVGALISSIQCSQNCPGCFNQHLQGQKYIRLSAQEIIERVRSNPLHQGIILGGLEWTEQPEEMRSLVWAALRSGFQVMIYTHLGEGLFKEIFPALSTLPVWIKFGDYRHNTNGTVSNGITLASDNQYVKWMGRSDSNE